jgi:dihydrofolate synthase/folylpolyglutamate synthase
MTPTPFERAMYALRRQGIKYDLDRMHALAERLGHPERAYRTLHVAGTNGKGSTAAMLAAGLAAAGHRVGLNTSPHLVSLRERFRVDGRALPDPELLEILEELGPFLDDVEASFFESATAVAFVAFARREVDVAVFEVGLGGRLDATNVITSAGAVITRIDLEHTRILGSTRAAIAREKAGILKGQPAVVAGDDPEVLEAIARVADDCGSPIVPVRRGIEWSTDPDGVVTLRSGERFRTALVGDHQAENGALAVTLLERLDADGVIAVPQPARRAAVESVTWAGRFDVRSLAGATVVFDVAHNPSGAEVLVRTVRERFPGRRVALVIGMLRDKAHEPFLRCIAPLTDDVTAVTPGSEDRKLEAADLAALAAREGIRADVEPDAGRAIRAAARRADVVVVTGSLFTVGDAMARLGVSPADEPMFRETMQMEDRR